MMVARSFAIVSLVAAALVGQPTVSSALVASGFANPVLVTAPRNDSARLFVVEQCTARIRIIRNGAVLPTPFLDINPLVSSNCGEDGLLGLAFHPNYAQNGFFYVSYTDNNLLSTIARYQVSANPDVANPLNPVTILTLQQPYSNHNGGHIAFGPEGYLYIGFGDGGSGNDPLGAGQDPNTWLGKMLRIDVDNPAPPLNYSVPPTNPFATQTGNRRLIWHWGLRNPWRRSFDRAFGHLYIADVGQNQVEEVNFVPFGQGGLNFGWRCREGNVCTGLSGCACPSTFLTDPIHTYLHSDGCSITGGYVYRGCAIPSLVGTYFFADYCTNRIWSFRVVNGVRTQFVERTSELSTPVGLFSISSFGEDARGEIYIVSHGGSIYRITGTAGNTNPLALRAAAPPTIGTTFSLQLSAPTFPAAAYVCGFSLGMEPVQPLQDGRIIPLANDSLLLASLDPASPFFGNTIGNLDALGVATVQVNLPMDPQLVGRRVFAAYAVAAPTASLGIGAISCALPLTIQ